eukprot:16450530-Heterocapsa_arctica.AAC.1
MTTCSRRARDVEEQRRWTCRRSSTREKEKAKEIIKGKGKGTFFDGSCNKCQKYGHRARDCSGAVADGH